MKFITCVELCLLDGTTIAIPAAYLGKCRLENIRDAVERTEDGILQYTTCDMLFLELNPAFDDPKTGDPGHITTFQLLEGCNNIAYATLYYEDRTSIDVYVPWEDSGPSGKENEYQSAYRSATGALYIAVCEQATARELISQSDIPDRMDNAAAMAEYWDRVQTVEARNSFYQ